MKKLVSLLLALLMLTLCIGAHAEATVTDLLPLVTSETEETAYMFSRNEDGAFHVWGSKEDGTGDAYANSKHILGRSVGDFTLEFDYTPYKVEWNQDRICFRVNPENENEWEQYMILICGCNLGEGQRGIAIVKGEERDNPFVYEEVWLDWDTHYFGKLVVKGNHVTFYFGEDPEFSEGPLLETDLPTETGETVPYRDQYLTEGDFQIVSWGGDFLMTYFNLIEEAE